jgi:hypothetical protein
MEYKKSAIIEAVSDKGDRYSVRVGDEWFSGFGKCDLIKGDIVDIEYEKKGMFNNIKKIEKTAVKQTECETEKIIARDLVITRQVAFKGAIEVVTELISKSNNSMDMTYEGIVEIVKCYTNEFSRVIMNE